MHFCNFDMGSFSMMKFVECPICCLKPESAGNSAVLKINIVNCFEYQHSRGLYHKNTTARDQTYVKLKIRSPERSPIEIVGSLLRSNTKKAAWATAKKEIVLIKLAWYGYWRRAWWITPTMRPRKTECLGSIEVPTDQRGDEEDVGNLAQATIWFGPKAKSIHLAWRHDYVSLHPKALWEWWTSKPYFTWITANLATATNFDRSWGQSIASLCCLRNSKDEYWDKFWSWILSSTPI